MTDNINFQQLRAFAAASERAGHAMIDLAKAVLAIADTLERARTEPTLFDQEPEPANT